MTCRISRADLFIVRIPLRFSVDHTLASRKENRTGFLVISDSQGRQGIGELLARPYVTGETPAHCVDFLQIVSQELPAACDLGILPFIKKLWSDHGKLPGVQGGMAAMDQALLDLKSQIDSVPVAEVLAQPAPAAVGSATYSAAYPLSQGIRRLALHLIFGTILDMKSIKIKGSGDLDRDLGAADSIRRFFGQGVTIRLDLNGGLAQSDAETYFRGLLMVDPPIRWVEQPFPKGDFHNSQRFQRMFASEIILCADESVCTLEDLEKTIRTEAFRAVNLRVAKNGGLHRTLEICEQARLAGLDTQLGCYVGETSVLAYAGLHFASLMPELRFHEGCFGRMLIRWDPVKPSLVFKRGGTVAFSRLPEVGLSTGFRLSELRQRATEQMTLGEFH